MGWATQGMGLMADGYRCSAWGDVRTVLCCKTVDGSADGCPMGF